jgi:serine phosphatase RsbU (regulator of sigma subunit)
MNRRLPVPLVLTLTFLLLIVLSLIAVGLYVRARLAESVADTEQIRAARLLVGDAVRAQIDEETGVRGYAVARDPVLLEPYHRGRANLPRYLQRIRVVTTNLGLREAPPFVTDATKTNRRWLTRVAFPLLLIRKGGHVLELRGKVLVDRFRADMAAVDRALVQRQQAGDARAQRAIVLVYLLALAAVAAIVLAAALFAVQQYGLGVSLEQERAASKRQRRQSAKMRAAYEAEKRVVDTLQRAFAQRDLPELPGLRLSATYVPATEEAKVGGDWYDALPLTHDRVLLAIGDVTGHGFEAAVAMNKARQTLISCALIDPNPGSILQRANAQLVADESPIITAVTGLVDARTCSFWYAAAGHPAPVLLEPGHRARFLDVGSLPLGLAAGTAYLTHRIRSKPGAMLVLYTDGAIEHSRDVVAGESLLLETVESAGQTHDDPASAILDGIFERRHVSDDVAIITVRFLEAAAMPDASALRRSA